MFSGFFLVSPTDLHPSLARMNEMIQSGILSENHCHLQEISMFTSIFVEISEDPLREITNLHNDPLRMQLSSYRRRYEVVSRVARLTMPTSESTMLERALEVQQEERHYLVLIL